MRHCIRVAHSYAQTAAAAAAVAATAAALLRCWWRRRWVGTAPQLSAVSALKRPLPWSDDAHSGQRRLEDVPCLPCLPLPCLQNPHCAAQTSLLAVHLARADPAMLSALRTAGMLDMIAKRQAELADRWEVGNAWREPGLPGCHAWGAANCIDIAPLQPRSVLCCSLCLPAACSTLPQLGAELEAALQQLEDGPPPQAPQAAQHEEQQAQQAAQHEEQQAQQQVQEPPATKQQQAQQQQAQQQPQPSATREELLALPVRELKAQLATAGVNSSGCAEKAELVDLLLQQQGASLSDQQQQNGGSTNRNGSTAAEGEAAPAAATAAEQVLPKRCAGCGAASGPAGQKLRRCSGCRAVHFCSEQCQQMAWPEHRGACRAVQQQQQAQVH